ncbi:MAG: asparagine--tRNA ligase [Patescibacteria group bacterium]|jgi:asparaginyl-tRNA synthetase|nr:asparagine--tRNA ligase [Patescibacteria group bacterium]
MSNQNIKQLYKETKKYLNEDIALKGWIRNIRSSNAFGFIELNDGSFFKSIQVVFENNLDNFEEISKVGIGSAISVKGILVKSEGGGQDFEVKASGVLIEGDSEHDYPLQKKRHSFEYLRTIAHLRHRSNTFSAVFRMRSSLSFAIHQFFQERNYIYSHTPIITTSDCEGAGEMFRVTTLDDKSAKKDDKGNIDYSEDFFGKLSGLTVSGQLNAEALAHGFKDVYTFGPTFRAENSHTTRHAAEFWMLEPEVAFADLNDNMDLAEDLINHMINHVIDHLPEEMEFFNKFIDKGLLERLEKIRSSKFERITYTKAIEILEAATKKFEFPVKWGIDLQTEHERYICEEVFDKPVFVTDYPKEIKAFYMRLNDDKKTVAAMDLLVPGIGEIIGGSQREERLEVLTERMKEAGLNPSEYQWYLDLRKYGGTKHAGFGLGFERVIMYFTGMQNIRDVIAFPRTPKNAEF